MRAVIRRAKREQLIPISERKDDFQGASPIHTYLPYNKCEVHIGEIYIGGVFFYVGSWTEQQARYKKFRGKERDQYFPPVPLFQ